MATSIQALSQLPFFAQLDEQALQRVAALMREQTVAPGQLIVLEGDPCQAVYFVLRGLLRTRRMSLNGREQVLAYLGPGAPANLVSALDGRPNPATLDAISAATLCVVSCQDFREILTTHRAVALAVSQYLAAEVRRLSDMVESLALHTVRSRLARFLLEHADSSAPPRQWTQEEIAAHIGTVREMVGRTLRAFADEGLIRRQRGRIVVVDREALRREARGPEESRDQTLEAEQ
jgi:CRP/FNR family transcriptional regulator